MTSRPLRRAARIAGLGAVVMAAEPASADPKDAASTTSPGGVTEGAPQAPDARGDSALSVRIEAQALRRQNGQWVLTHVVPVPAEPHSAAEGVGSAPDPEDERKLLSLLGSYARALEARDLGELSRVWVMNPAEREHLGRLFANSEAPRVSIWAAEIREQGDRALLRFDQILSFARAPRVAADLLERAYRRALAAKDDLGRWSLDELATDE